MDEHERRDTNGQDAEDFAMDMIKENRMIEEKENEVEELKKLYSETKDLNMQYFRNILDLQSYNGKLKFISISELVIIIILGLVIL